MIVKDESQDLRQCLTSVQNLADQIVVVDTGSTDNTPFLAKEMGAEVYHFPWTNDFSEARNFALSKAQGDWIFVLDADEMLPAESQSILRQLIRPVSSPLRLYLPRIQNVLDPQNLSSRVDHYMVRVFPNHPDLIFTGRVHEQVQSKNPELRTEQHPVPELILWHYGYTPARVSHKRKLARNQRLLKIALQNEPHNAFYWFNLGRTFRQTRDQDRALSAFEKALLLSKDLTPPPPYITACYIDTLSLLIQMDRPQAALQYAEKAPQTCLSCPDYWLNYGAIWLALKDFKHAIQAFEKARTRPPARGVLSDTSAHTWKPLMGLAEAYQAIGDSEKAIVYFQEALDVNPTHQQARLQLGYLHYESGAYTEALRHFEKALDLGNSSFSLYRGIGLCFLQTQRHTEARNAFLLALEAVNLSGDDQVNENVSGSTTGVSDAPPDD